MPRGVLWGGMLGWTCLCIPALGSSQPSVGVTPSKSSYHPNRRAIMNHADTVDTNPRRVREAEWTHPVSHTEQDTCTQTVPSRKILRQQKHIQASTGFMQFQPPANGSLIANSLIDISLRALLVSLTLSAARRSSYDRGRPPASARSGTAVSIRSSFTGTSARDCANSRVLTLRVRGQLHAPNFAPPPDDPHAVKPPRKTEVFGGRYSLLR